MGSKFWKNKKVVVTGANGFLASHLTIALLERGTKVTALIKEKLPISMLTLRLKEKKYKNLTIIKGDIINYPFVERLFKRNQPDLCFHIAAQAIVSKANKSPLPTFKTNIMGTWNILELIRLFSRRTRIIVASSDKAYGDHRELPYREEASLNALHPYDASKACTDILTRTYAHTYNISTAVTRCANLYGPGDNNFSRIIPDTIRSVLLNRDPIIRSDGTPLRDYIYIKDAVSAYLCLAKALYFNKKNVKGEAFNIGTGRPISVQKLVNLILRISNKSYLCPQILSKHKISGEIDRQYLSIGKARRILNWRPTYSLTEGLTLTLNWYKMHLKNIEHIK